MKVLFIDIDTLRPDHMGCYGYNRNTTPTMDKIAEEGVRFNRYYTSDAPCLPSRSALVSGMFGIRNGAVGHGGTCGDQRLVGYDRDFNSAMNVENLHYIFREAGMKTASISTFAERHSSYWFNAGFHETYNVGGCGGEVGSEVLPIALDWLERNKEEDDWYLHVHFWDPHTPYRAPEEMGAPFENEPMPEWITEEVFQKHLKHVGPHSINEISMFTDKDNPSLPRQAGKCSTLEEAKRFIDNYDTGILYADNLVGEIVEKLKAQGIYDDVVIIVTSDHGENMGELGLYAEHGTADNITCNIPMIIKWPGKMAGHVDNDFHYSLDLLPTLANMLGCKVSDRWDGQSFQKVIETGDSQGREEVVISQMAHVCQRSARFGDWLYMRTYHDGFHLFDKEMLYNIAEDPHEQYDVKEQYPEVCMKGAKIILDWVDEQRMKDTTQEDPLWTVLSEGGPYHTWNHLDDYLVRLENTGRSEGAKQLREKYKNQKVKR